MITDRELFGSVRVRRPKALRRVVPRDILERLTPGDLVVHIDHGIARYEQMLRRGGDGRGARLPRAELRGRRPDLRPGRADRPRQPLLRRRASRAQPAGRRPTGCGPSSGSRRPSTTWPRSSSSCTPTRAGAEGHAFPADTPVAGRDGGELPVRGDGRPAAGDRRDEGRHGIAPADGPAGRRRRRLRQDRGRDPGRVQGDPGRPAGRRPRADHGPRRPARHDVLAALRGVSR